MKESRHLRSKLGIARGLGSAHHGVGHWWVQRLTAVALIPLGLWFVYSLLSAMQFPNAATVGVWLSSPLAAVAIVLLLGVGFYHSKLGLQVVIEDYIKCPYTKYGLLLLNNFASFVLAAISIIAVLKLHFIDISGLI